MCNINPMKVYLKPEGDERYNGGAVPTIMFSFRLIVRFRKAFVT